ncbi:hypothetical protein WJX81_002476 [Elliptochloris bilobata]|uniref:Protein DETOXIFICATION n=1 Tax=Elliptochloris bilobata TaxID=381761 RepID=A0AAW1RDY1_9CHLO
MAKKKKQRSASKARQADLNEEAQEELVALAAIFDEHFAADEDGRGFQLVVFPHQGDSHANFVSVILSCRFPPRYPNQALVLRLSGDGLDTADVRRLSKALHAEAETHAAGGRVCCFNLVEQCQDLLQQRNEPPSPVTKALPASLWHEWLEREPADTEALDARADAAAEEPGLRVLDGRSERGSESGGGADTEEDAPAREQVRRDLLLGHLMLLATEGTGPHALNALAARLAEGGLLPRWVHLTLTQHPDLFYRAFRRMFRAEVDMWAGTAASDPAATWALERFWQQPGPGSGGAHAAGLLAGAARSLPPEAPSRFLTDFQELRVLGRGAYGVVVQAVNRLDGRPYAVKKILMQAASPAARARLMREVSTLARLHHPGIVRYFQAWCEAPSGEGPADAEGSEADDWLTETSECGRPDSAGAIFLPPRLNHSSFASPAFDLPRVSEASSEGALSSLPASRARSDGEQKAALDEGPMDDLDAWQVVRQILGGLAHIHAQNIIHRDLKPANIFFDSRGDIKLGDFGLAKFASNTGACAAPAEEAGQLPQEVAQGQSHAGDSSDRRSGRGHHQRGMGAQPSDATGQVGTSFYISPEIRDGWARYDERTDLYSLGVVAFELWHPFETGMERAVLLADLQSSGALPAEWEAAQPQAARLVRWLTQHNPAERPSAVEVLRSELLPPSVADEQLTDLLRSIPESPETAERVVDALFALPSDAGVPLDELAGAPVAMPRQVEAREALVDVLRAVFASHGAVPMGSRELGFRAPGAPPDTAALLAASGARLAARHNLRSAFAAWLARRASEVAARWDLPVLEGLRRYEVGWVWRRGVGRAPPRAYLQADFDLISPPGLAPAEALLCDAEAIRAVIEALQALPEAHGEWEVRLGHAAILEAALAHARVPRGMRGPALALLATTANVSPRQAGARTRDWAGVRAALAGLGLPERAIAACKQFVAQVPGETEAAMHRLRSKLDSGAGPRGLPPAITAALEALATLAGHLRAWGLAGAQLAIDPLLRPHAECFSGIVYQIHLVAPDTGASQLVAVGGRWDGLLKAAWPVNAPSAGVPPGAAGITLNVERLLDCLPSTRSPAMRASQAEVLVCARGGGGLLRERMALAARLWEAGVRAELLPAAAPSLTAQYEYAHVRGIAWLAILAADTLHAADTVRVKSLERRTEDNVPIADLARYLTAGGLLTQAATMPTAIAPGAVRAEVGALLRLAVPVSSAFLLNKSISFVGVLFVSHLGPAPLAAASLATSLANVTGYSLMAGLAGATSTLCGQAFGAKNYPAVGAWLQRSVIILSLCCVPIAVLWAFTERLLLAVGQDPQVAAMTGAFILWLMPSLVFYASICSIGNYLTAQGIVRAPFYVAGVAAALHPGVNYLLIDVLGMGYLGAALAVSVSNGVQLTGLCICLLIGKKQRHTWVPWSRGCLRGWGQFLALAIPSCLMMFEWIASEVAVMLAGLLPDPKRSLSAMAVYQNSNSLAFMVPLGLAIAVITRVSNDLGAGSPNTARRAAWVAAAMSACIMLVLAIPAVLLRLQWGRAFTDDPELLHLIAVSTLTLGPYIVFDGLQTVLAGVMRGSGRQAAAVPVILTAYYLLGLPLGAYLAFRRGMGVLGLCLGMLVGTACHALAFLAVVGCFNWHAEADKAMRRVAPKLGEAVPGAVVVRASSCEGEPSDATQPLLWEHCGPDWRHTADGGVDAPAAAAGALEGAAAVDGVARVPAANGV